MYSDVKYAPRVPLTLLKVEKIEGGNFDFVVLLSFSSHITQNPRAYTYTNVLHIKQLLCYQRCSFSGLELHVSYNWQVTAPNMLCSPFSVCHFVHTYTHNLKIRSRIWTFHISNDTLLSDIFLCWVRAACKLRLLRYGTKQASQSLSNMPFCPYLQA